MSENTIKKKDEDKNKLDILTEEEALKLLILLRQLQNEEAR